MGVRGGEGGGLHRSDTTPTFHNKQCIRQISVAVNIGLTFAGCEVVNAMLPFIRCFFVRPNGDIDFEVIT